MKITTIALLLFAFFSTTQAQADCGKISCLDYCTNSYVELTGDSCGSELDVSRNCLRATASCSSGDSNSCGRISCLDYCTNSYVEVDGNSCTTELDLSHNCLRAAGRCW